MPNQNAWAPSPGQGLTKRGSCLPPGSPAAEAGVAVWFPAHWDVLLQMKGRMWAPPLFTHRPVSQPVPVEPASLRDRLWVWGNLP